MKWLKFKYPTTKASVCAEKAYTPRLSNLKTRLLGITRSHTPLKEDNYGKV
jgi:hypothetical protein